MLPLWIACMCCTAEFDGCARHCLCARMTKKNAVSRKSVAKTSMRRNESTDGVLKGLGLEDEGAVRKGAHRTGDPRQPPAKADALVLMALAALAASMPAPTSDLFIAFIDFRIVSWLLTDAASPSVIGSLVAQALIVSGLHTYRAVKMLEWEGRDEHGSSRRKKLLAALKWGGHAFARASSLYLLSLCLSGLVAIVVEAARLHDWVTINESYLSWNSCSVLVSLAVTLVVTRTKSGSEFLPVWLVFSLTFYSNLLLHRIGIAGALMVGAMETGVRAWHAHVTRAREIPVDQ